jgi:hypothetical protein
MPLRGPSRQLSPTEVPLRSNADADSHDAQEISAETNTEPAAKILLRSREQVLEGNIFV